MGMIALRMFLWMSLLTGIFYPLAITMAAKLFMPHQSNGSLVYVDNKLVGSKLLGQKFEQERYFWPRPSAGGYNTLPSSASNLGPTSLELKRQVNERRKKLQKFYKTDELPSDLLYTSASGLDPHITLDGAYIQMERVAAKRGMQIHDLKQLVDAIATRKYVNVLLLNLALDQKDRDARS